MRGFESHRLHREMSAEGMPPGSRGPMMVLEVELVLRASLANDDGPMSVAEIARRIPFRRVTASLVRRCVDRLKLLNLATEDPNGGVMWTLHEDPAFRARKGLLRL